jgi:hypothetical protein
MSVYHDAAWVGLAPGTFELLLSKLSLSLGQDLASVAAELNRRNKVLAWLDAWQGMLDLLPLH